VVDIAITSARSRRSPGAEAAAGRGVTLSIVHGQRACAVAAHRRPASTAVPSPPARLCCGPHRWQASRAASTSVVTTSTASASGGRTRVARPYSQAAARRSGRPGRAARSAWCAVEHPCAPRLEQLLQRASPRQRDEGVRVRHQRFALTHGVGDPSSVESWSAHSRSTIERGSPRWSAHRRPCPFATAHHRRGHPGDSVHRAPRYPGPVTRHARLLGATSFEDPQYTQNRASAQCASSRPGMPR